MEGKDVVDGYSDDLKEQIGQLSTDEISALTDQVVEYGNSIKELTEEQVRNIIAFFEHEEIPSKSRIIGVRDLSYGSMRQRFISAPLAIRLAKDIETVPKGFWDTVDDVIIEIDVCNDFEKLMAYVVSADTERVRKAAALKAARIATTEEEREALYNATKDW